MPTVPPLTVKTCQPTLNEAIALMVRIIHVTCYLLNMCEMLVTKHTCLILSLMHGIEVLLTHMLADTYACLHLRILQPTGITRVQSYERLPKPPSVVSRLKSVNSDSSVPSSPLSTSAAQEGGVRRTTSSPSKVCVQFSFQFGLRNALRAPLLL